ncbi:hypothetical protein [Solitalea koreensis]|uniref:Protein involved in gliding motility RemB n=1 Tax=Solitalea koreensis TaxID=543615 RepID=A0A521CQ72_9SPHI|nr:hypothetical protein [Solitalea koreensis]SMO61597.1 hypothetical protein SAMN06265350_104265 [Solitalea koreensis]
MKICLRILVVSILALYSFSAIAQTTTNLGTYVSVIEAKQLYTDLLPRHTSIRPYLKENKDWADTTTVFEFSEKRKSLVLRKLFDEHLVEYHQPGYSLAFDFLPDFQIGKESGNNQTLWLNTRGFYLGGSIGKNFSFYTTFYENQGVFPAYVKSFADSNRVIPGQGEVRPYGNGGFDYAYSAGRLSYTPSKFFNFDLGYDRNFLGDGYRSLLLSDVTTPYPYFKVTTTVGPLRYWVMWSQLIDMRAPQFSYDTGYRKKWGVFHYLDWNVSKKVSIGLFENIIWQDADSTGKRGFDWSYMNPFIFLRPVEFANGSPDNAMVGINAKYKVLKKTSVYGQFFLDEFKESELFSDKGWWANKWGAQIGFKSFDIFKVNNLYAQGEFNTIRPYTSSSRTSLINYGHYNQPLGHPWGANFRELLGIINYTWQRFDFRGQLSYGNYGLDAPGDNFGKNIFLSYDTRESDYENHIGQGIFTHLYFGDFKTSYIFNPKYNLRLELGLAYRREKNDLADNKATIISFGLRSSFRNLYNDF